MSDKKKTLLASILEKVANADDVQRGMILAYAQGLAEGAKLAAKKEDKDDDDKTVD